MERKKINVETWNINNMFSSISKHLGKWMILENVFIYGIREPVNTKLENIWRAALF